jgi:hypothetical protein
MIGRQILTVERKQPPNQVNNYEQTIFNPHGYRGPSTRGSLRKLPGMPDAIQRGLCATDAIHPQNNGSPRCGVGQFNLLLQGV